MSETPKERAKRIGVPLIPKLPPQRQYDPNPIVAICGECGRDVRMYEGYLCGNMNCPTTPKVTS